MGDAKRPDCVRAGDEETERLLWRAFRAGFHEGKDRTLDIHLRAAFDDWRGGVVTREVSSLSFSQIDWLDRLLQGYTYPGPEIRATLRVMRAELSKEDDGAA